MGFRSTLISDDYPGILPEWFKQKYKQNILFPNGLLVASKREAKYYSPVFFEDYQKAVKESGFWDKHPTLSIKSIKITVLAEDGVVSLVNVSKSNITYYMADFTIEMAAPWGGGY